jgi:hypothetical protein
MTFDSFIFFNSAQGVISSNYTWLSVFSKHFTQSTTLPFYPTPYIMIQRNGAEPVFHPFFGPAPTTGTTINMQPFDGVVHIVYPFVFLPINGDQPGFFEPFQFRTLPYTPVTNVINNTLSSIGLNITKLSQKYRAWQYVGSQLRPIYYKCLPDVSIQ